MVYIEMTHSGKKIERKKNTHGDKMNCLDTWLKLTLERKRPQENCCVHVINGDQNHLKLQSFLYLRKKDIK